MKRTFVLLLALISLMSAYSTEISREVVYFYFPSLVGSPFGEKAEIFVNGDDGKIRLEYKNRQTYNAHEFENFAAYSIPEGSRLYLKLSNGDIITLICQNSKDVKNGFVEGRNGVYEDYINCSYFPMDETTIEQLKKYEIVKIRAELKKGIYDASLKPTEKSAPNRSDFNSAYQYVVDKMKKAERENSRQLELQENPLLDF